MKTLDTTRIDDVRIGAVRPLINPALLQERVPLQDDTLALVEASRVAIADVLHGRSDRLVVVVGPCSIHDPVAGIDYARDGLGERGKPVAQVPVNSGASPFASAMSSSTADTSG